MIIVYIILILLVAHWPRYHKLDIHRVLSVKCVSVCVLCVLNRTDSRDYLFDISTLATITILCTDHNNYIYLWTVAECCYDDPSVNSGA